MLKKVETSYLKMFEMVHTSVLNRLCGLFEKKVMHRVFIKIVFFPYVIFLNSASSAAALVFYLPGV